MKRATFIAWLALYGAMTLQSAVVLPPLISDHMVLQTPTAQIWGKAEPGEEVAVSFGETSARTIASPEGRWSVKLAGLKPGSVGELVVEGQNRLVVKDVLAGEVWLAAGQSNMALTMQALPDFPQYQSRAVHPQIRMFLVAKRGARDPKADTRGRWVPCTPETVGIWSAVGYFFAKDLQSVLGQPIGIINSSVGNTQANAWTPKTVLESDPLLRETYLVPWAKQMERYPADMTAYQAALERWTEANGQAEKSGQRAPAKPRLPPGPDSHRAPAALYNAMIHGLTAYTIRGALWYQGESDVQTPEVYRRLLPAMIGAWRQEWGETFPFLIVQLPNFQPRRPTPGRSLWAELREVQQEIAESIPQGELCTIIDIGKSGEIHPPNKQEVGRRLSLLAQAKVHERQIVHTGPVFERVQFNASDALLHFRKGTADGLTTGDAGAVKGFFIAGEDRKFHPAAAEIVVAADGLAVKVHADQVRSPVAVRYAWEDDPAVNLTNGAGLPARPFRTDQWKR